MRDFLSSLVPYLIWVTTSVSLGAGTSFPFGLKWYFAVPLFIFNASVFGFAQFKGWESYQMYMGRRDIMLMRMAENDRDARERLVELEQEKVRIAFETSMPSVLCPHCQQSKQMTYIRIPYDFDGNKNIFTCPKCKEDFGVHLHVQTYQVKTELTASEGEPING